MTDVQTHRRTPPFSDDAHNMRSGFEIVKKASRIADVGGVDPHKGYYIDATDSKTVSEATVVEWKIDEDGVYIEQFPGVSLLGWLQKLSEYSEFVYTDDDIRSIGSTVLFHSFIGDVRE